MIESPLLALVAKHIADLAASSASVEEQNAERIWLEQSLENQAREETTWRRLLVDEYCSLETDDLRSLPIRAHHWLIERMIIASPFGIRPRPGFFADLFELLDPFGRYLTIKALASEGEFDEQFRNLVTRSSDAPADRRTIRVREIADILLDLRLGEPQGAFERTPTTRALITLFELSRRYQSTGAEDAVRTRASRVGGELGRALLALLGESDRRF